MQKVGFFQSQSSSEIIAKSNEEDPKQLKKALVNLIEKSKNIIATLEETLAKLEKVQTERDFWKNHYFRLKESCEKYIQAKGLQPFSYIANLEDQVKSLLVQNQCLEESRMSMKSRELGNSTYERKVKKKGEGHKSISTFSFRESPQSSHKIGPKKINLFKLADKKNPLQ